jgi:hypothetical protein
MTSRSIWSRLSRPASAEQTLVMMEFSLTQIVDRPLRGRQFFEELIQDNLDWGRPGRVRPGASLWSRRRNITCKHGCGAYIIRKKH